MGPDQMAPGAHEATLAAPAVINQRNLFALESDSCLRVSTTPNCQIVDVVMTTT